MRECERLGIELEGRAVALEVEKVAVGALREDMARVEHDSRERERALEDAKQLLLLTQRTEREEEAKEQRATLKEKYKRSKPVGLQIGAPATIKSYEDFFSKKMRKKI